MRFYQKKGRNPVKKDTNISIEVRGLRSAAEAKSIADLERRRRERVKKQKYRKSLSAQKKKAIREKDKSAKTS